MTYDAVCCYGEMTILAGVGGGVVILKFGTPV